MGSSQKRTRNLIWRHGEKYGWEFWRWSWREKGPKKPWVKAWRGARIPLAVFFGLLTVWYGLWLMGSDGCVRWSYGCVPFLQVGLSSAVMGGILVGVGIWWLMVSLRKGMA